MIELLQWKDSYDLGIPSIDQQHRRLLTLINRGLEATTFSLPGQAMLVILEDLSAYLNEHFRWEEKLLEQAKYPELARHREEHAEFRRRVETLTSQFRNHEIEMKSQVLAPLGEWFYHHLIGEDRKYLDCLLDAGLDRLPYAS